MKTTNEHKSVLRNTVGLLNKAVLKMEAISAHRSELILLIRQNIGVDVIFWLLLAVAIAND